MTPMTATTAAPRTLRFQRATKNTEPQELAKVSISGFYYVVDFGPEVMPRMHYVSKDRTCSCDLVDNCPAVDAVLAYLKAGGDRAPDPPAGFFVHAPAKCPQCGAPTHVKKLLSSQVRGTGWTCEKGGDAHYWNTRGDILIANFRKNPWLFPPAVVRDGVLEKAWDGVMEGDKVLYEGVRRIDVCDADAGYAYGYIPAELALI